MSSRRHLAPRLTLLLGTATVVLGYLGYSDLDPEAQFGATVYRAVQLLGFEYSGPADPGLVLESARWLGALTVGMAFIAVVAGLARERVDRFVVRVLARKHFVLVGLHERGAALASALQDGGERVVVIENDPVAMTRVPGPGRIDLINLDPRDRRAYRDVAVRRAKHVFIAPGDDSENLLALEACLAELGEDGPCVHIAIDGQLLWRELHRSSLASTESGPAIEFISMPDRVAARLVEEMTEHLQDGPVTVWGSGSKATRTAVHAVRWSLLDGRQPELILAGPDVEGLKDELLGLDPWLKSSTKTIKTAPEPTGVDSGAAFVVGLGHADALAGASVLAERSDGLAICAEVSTTKGTNALRRSGFRTDRVQLVDAEAQILGSGLFEGSARELIARAKHADYLARDRAREVTVEANSSLVPWEELPESLQESNRRFAESVGRKLKDLDTGLEPLSGPTPPSNELMTDGVVEDLAKGEHQRWVADLERDGWRRTDGAKDAVLKVHPLMVDWNELSESDREKDREAIRVLPEALARVGYEIRKNGVSRG